MTIPFSPAGRANYPMKGELRWSKSERATARKAFDHALNQELQEVIQQAKQMAAAIKQPSELWELEHHRKYEFRVSKLTFVFGTLIHEGRLAEQELRGLREDKLEAIRSHAGFLSSRDEPI